LRRFLAPASPPAVYALVAALCAAVKGAILAFDRTLCFQSDSGSYLVDSLRLVPSWPRPLGYGTFLHVVWAAAGGVDFSALLLAQAAVGAALGVLTFALGERALSLPRAAAAAAALVVTASPLELQFERFLLSDALALAVAALALVALFVYLARPGFATAAALGLAAMLPCLVRSVWVFLPPLLVGLAAFWQLAAPPRRRTILRLAAALACSLAVYSAYSIAFTRHNTGKVDATSDPSGFGGWLLWATVSPFAEPDDLAGMPGGALLTEDTAELRRRSPVFQIWDFNSAPHKVARRYYNGNLVAANRFLLHAGLRVALHHPVRYALSVVHGLGAYFRPHAVADDYSRPLKLATRTRGQLLRFGGLDFDRAPREESRLAPAFRVWRWSRPLLSSALVIVLAAGLLAPRRRFPFLVVGAVGGAYLAAVDVAVPYLFVERYYLPVEYFGVLSAALLAAALLRRLDRRRATTAADAAAVATPSGS
jgi:hypothetical protein